jgi:putative ABC transport system ATP-binding protein
MIAPGKSFREGKVPETQITLDNVCKVYPMGRVEVHALSEVSLEIERGEFVVFMGPSGSGKTTLLNLIGGIDSPTSGRVVVDGVETSSLDEKGLTEHRRSRIGFIFQFFNLIPTLTARENVEFAAELSERARNALDVLEEVGLGERADHFPSELSGGEQQRVAIARALAKDPPILLCDEPTGELDFETGKRILGVMRRINREEGKTVILVTHNTAIGQIADRVVRLRSGRVVEETRNASPPDPDGLRW